MSVILNLIELIGEGNKTLIGKLVSSFSLQFFFLFQIDIDINFCCQNRFSAFSFLEFSRALYVLEFLSRYINTCIHKMNIMSQLVEFFFSQPKFVLDIDKSTCGVYLELFVFKQKSF